MKFAVCLMLISIAAISAGCAPTDCAGWRPINAASSDVLTRMTKQQIVAHNEFGETKCGWRPPAGR